MFAMLKVLWFSFYDICRFRLLPKNLPHSSKFLIFTLLFYIIISILIATLQLSLKDAVLSILVDAGMLIVLISSLLYMAHCPSRITQTLTALFGINCVFEMMSIPLLVWITMATGDVSIPILLIAGVMIWKTIVYAHILRHALEVPFFMGFILIIIISFLTLMALDQVIPIIK